MKILKKPLDIDFIKKWINKGIDPIILSILNRRGLKDEEELFDFLSPLIENIFSPFLFKDIVPAFKRIDTAITNNEKIIVFGDRDVDGATSTVMLIDFLKKLGAVVEYEIPINDEPFGLNSDKFKSWENKNFKLCITVDCGITNIEETALLNKMKIDTIIIDHHQPLANLPEAYTIINPKNEKNIKFNNIAACGVLFVFIFGYYFYKSKLFNKKIALFFNEQNILKTIIYENMIASNAFDYKNFDKINDNEIDQYYFYDENPTNYKNILNSIPNKNIKILNSITDIYSNSMINIIDDIKIKSKISLFHELFNSIKNLENILKNYLPLVMLGTIADLMPLIKINRFFVYYGLIYLKELNLDNFNMLFNQLNLNINELTSKDISWTICPILNSPGRMGDANITINFLNNNIEEDIISKIIKINDERKIKGDEAYSIFLNEINQNKSNYDNNLIFFYSNNIEIGITGITANKLSKISNCPTIVAAQHGDFFTGSIRGECNYHFVDFLEKGSNLLLQFGGHKQAAGFKFHKNNLEDFKKFLIINSSLFSKIKNNEELVIDVEIPLKYLEYDLLSKLNILEPFGIDNPNPVLFTPSLKILNFLRIGKHKQHLKIFFETDSIPFIGLFWDKGEWFENIHKNNAKYDVAYKLETNKYNRQITLQMIILDLKKSEY